MSVADHAADAKALLDHLDRAHIAGHSSGAAVALQLALDHPAKVHSLILLEPSLLSVASAQAFFAKAGPAFDAFASGKHEQALQIFMTAASGLPWEQCRALLEQRVPGSVAQSLKDADTFFGVELPALQQWSFTPAQAATIRQPIPSVVGTKTEPLWIEVDALLASAMPRAESSKISGRRSPAAHPSRATGGEGNGCVHRPQPDPCVDAWHDRTESLSSTVLDRIANVTGARSARRAARVQRLWDGYGEVFRVELDHGVAPTAIVKRVAPPAGVRGTPSDQRKRRRTTSSRRSIASSRRAATTAVGSRSSMQAAAATASGGSCSKTSMPRVTASATIRRVVSRSMRA